MNARKIAVISIFSSLAAALRIFKHMVFGSFQFINIPLSFVFLTSYFFGGITGTLVGFLSFAVSDALLGFGLWTITNSAISGLLSLPISLLKKVKSKTLLFVMFYILTFIYDILSSLILYVILGIPLRTALAFSVIGLFLPIQGGYMIGVGPITEFSTALLTILLIYSVERRLASYQMNLSKDFLRER
ncbi:MAG: hypothetical protein DRJ64_06415 [Thermoprotei archaeon]|nr:MAG: hypothetical protein DRJ64_06415 [Thermoprotei archaeon]